MHSPHLCSPNDTACQSNPRGNDTNVFTAGLFCSPMSVQARAKTRGLELNLCLAWKDKSACVGRLCRCVHPFYFQPTYLYRQELTISALCTHSAHISIQVLFSVIRIHSQEHLGCTVQISAPGFWPLQCSAGLMSGRKEGFPPLLQEKHPQFDDSLECSKLSFH